MKHLIGFELLLTLVLSTPSSPVLAQPRFEIPIIVTDGVLAQTLYFGILPGGHYCIDESDSINGHIEQFFIPPEGSVFDARFVQPRIGVYPCFDQGSPCDFRPFINEAQRDTFRVKSQLGMGTILLLSWPANLATRFTQLTLRYFDQVAITNVNVNMLTNTSADVTNAGDPATITIYSELGVIISVEPLSSPLEFKLLQNYPNPFNPTTNIRFQVADFARTNDEGGRGFVSLKVYDVLGREVATIVSERLSPGTYERTFNADDITSGVYFYKLESGGFVQTRKFLLLQ
jgi:hypothetical protein